MQEMSLWQMGQNFGEQPIAQGRIDQIDAKHRFTAIGRKARSDMGWQLWPDSGEKTLRQVCLRIGEDMPDLAFLDDAGGAFAPFAEALAVGPYAPDPAAFDGPGLLAAARRWIVRHHA